MVNGEGELDWQAERVIDRLLGELIQALQHWLNDHGLTTRLSSDTVRRHLTAALDFTGERADGYLMARFLEDNRSWPANQDLVAVLATANKLRERVMIELRREAEPKPVMPEMDEDGFYPVGTTFSNEAGHRFLIVAVHVTTNMYTIRRLNEPSKGMEGFAPQGRVNDLIVKHYQGEHERVFVAV